MKPNTIQLEARHLEMIKSILSSFKQFSFYAFGSRTKQTAQKFSDLDLLILESIDDITLSNIEEIFHDSDLPFKVDITPRARMSDQFFNLIKADFVKIELSICPGD